MSGWETEEEKYTKLNLIRINTINSDAAKKTCQPTPESPEQKKINFLIYFENKKETIK